LAFEINIREAAGGDVLAEREHTGLLRKRGEGLAALLPLLLTLPSSCLANGKARLQAT
jgi:hypothetical protein